MVDKLFEWQNFDLGYELRVSGNFIYDGLKTLDEIEYIFDKMNGSEQVFNFMYNISVGIERLQKICIILMENDENTDQDQFTKDITTHHHRNLIERIKGSNDTKLSINFSKEINRFIDILDLFYKKNRYMRYELKNAMSEREDKMLLDYLVKNKKTEVNMDNQVIHNSDDIKIFIGKIIGSISNKLYELIEEQCSRLQLYTYELSILHIKSFKIFGSKEFTFINERNAWKEIIVYLLANNSTPQNQPEGLKELKEYIEGIEPLEFDEPIRDILGAIDSHTKRSDFTSHVESIRDLHFENISKPEVENRNNKLKHLDNIPFGEW